MDNQLYVFTGKRTKELFVSVAFLVLVQFSGCSKSAMVDFSDWALDTDGYDSSTSTDAPVDSGFETDDTDTGPMVQIIIINNTGTVAYLDGYTTVSAEKLVDNNYVPVQLRNEMCDHSCEFYTELGKCNPPCINFSAMAVVLPQEQIVLPWNMMALEPDEVTSDELGMTCQCKSEYPVAAGLYRLKLEVFHTYECQNDDCPPPANSDEYLTDYWTSGTSTIMLGEPFRIPLTQSELYVTMSDD